jgi:hypothetical protein
MSTDTFPDSAKQRCLVLGVWFNVLLDVRAARWTYRRRKSLSERDNNGWKLTITRSWYSHSRYFTSRYLTYRIKFPEVAAVFSALIKYKSLQERFQDQQTMIGTLTNRLHREEAMRDEERKGALVEQGLIR